MTAVPANGSAALASIRSAAYRLRGNRAASSASARKHCERGGVNWWACGHDQFRQAEGGGHDRLNPPEGLCQPKTADGVPRPRIPKLSIVLGPSRVAPSSLKPLTALRLDAR